jgi:hypothetical protein
MWPRLIGQIHTSVQAGGMASRLNQAILSGSVMRVPLGPMYIQPRPARRRRTPGRRSVT